MGSDLEAPGSGGELRYVEIANEIEAEIRNGKLRPGARLISERDLAVRFGVAYATARRATRLLRERGLIRTVTGRGNFVK